MHSDLGERLLILRRRRGFSQGTLAKAADMHRNTIARVEQGDIEDLSGQTLLKLAKALGCSTDMLLGAKEIDEAELLAAVAS